MRWVEVFSQRAAECDAAVDRRDFPQAAGRPSARLDLHFGDAGGEPRFRPLHSARWAWTRRAPARWDSPFDYPEQGAALRARRACPRPTRRDYTDAVAAAALAGDPGQPAGAPSCCAPPCARCADVHELLRERVRARRAGLSRCCCRARVRAANCWSVSAAWATRCWWRARAFWEGVDVRGEALSLVVIDKLPFAPPDDPVLAARIDI